MPVNTYKLILLSALAITCFGCKQQRAVPRGPIVMGDSATIITETDSTLLQDLVPDIALPGSETPDTVVSTAVTAAPAKDTVAAAPQTAPPPAVQAAAPAGYSVDFGNVTIVLAGANIKESGKKFTGSNSAALTTSSDNFSGTGISISKGKITKVQQRSQAVAVAKRGNDILYLADLGTSSTGWQTIIPKGNLYPLAPVSKLSFPKANANNIRNAVQRAAQKKRLSRSAQQQWVNAVKNVRTIGSGPVITALKSVTWKVEGKDAAGKSFNKEIRVDIPM